MLEPCVLDPKGPSHYLRTKGEAESYLMTYGKRFANITIFDRQ